MSTRTTQSSGKYLNYAQGFFGGAKGRAGVEALPDTAPQPSCHGLCQLETFPSSPDCAAGGLWPFWVSGQQERSSQGAQLDPDVVCRDSPAPFSQMSLPSPHCSRALGHCPCSAPLCEHQLRSLGNVFLTLLGCKCFYDALVNKNIV